MDFDMSNDLNRNHLDVIKCEMSNNVLVERSTVENFNTLSQLVVNESQEALFYKDGQALDLFGPGRYSLTTDNLPFIKKIVGAFFGGQTVFTCQVYFINKVSVLDLMWGTDSAIVVEDPKYHIIVNVRGNGSTGIRVVDSRRFVTGVVGQLPEFTVESVRRAIKGNMMMHIKETISKSITEQGVSILEITNKLSELSAAVQDKINVFLADFGLEAVHFNINGIYADEKDLSKLREVKERVLEADAMIDIEANKIRKISDAKAYMRETEGFTYQEQRQFDVLQTAAENNSVVGGMIGASMGLGMGMGFADQSRSMAGNVAPQTQTTAQGMRACSNCQAQIPAQSKFCPECGNTVPQGKACTKCGSMLAPGAKFCPECGTPVPTASFCANCGGKLAPGAKFCPECGKSTTAQPVEAQNTQNNSTAPKTKLCPCCGNVVLADVKECPLCTFRLE